MIEVTPEMLAAAWKKARDMFGDGPLVPKDGRPRPGFKECLEAALAVAPTPKMNPAVREKMKELIQTARPYLKAYPDTAGDTAAAQLFRAAHGLPDLTPVE